MKMNKEDMAKMENEPGEGMMHEKAEGPAYEKKEDVMEGEDSGEEDMGEESDWKANCDANDLLRAAEIKADPARMKAALAVLGQKKKAIDSMEELMAVRKEKMMEKKS